MGSCSRSQWVGPVEQNPGLLCTEPGSSQHALPTALATTRKPDIDGKMETKALDAMKDYSVYIWYRRYMQTNTNMT